MCDCISYNRPELGGKSGSVSVRYDVENLIPPAMRPWIDVDACIVGQVKALWNVGIETGGCCCSHNGVLGPAPSVMILNARDAALARQVLMRTDPDRPWQITCWSN